MEQDLTQNNEAITKRAEQIMNEVAEFIFSNYEAHEAGLVAGALLGMHMQIAHNADVDLIALKRVYEEALKEYSLRKIKPDE